MLFFRSAKVQTNERNNITLVRKNFTAQAVCFTVCFTMRLLSCMNIYRKIIPTDTRVPAGRTYNKYDEKVLLCANIV